MFIFEQNADEVAPIHPPPTSFILGLLKFYSDMDYNRPFLLYGNPNF
jgi:hypothetical protein